MLARVHKVFPGAVVLTGACLYLAAVFASIASVLLELVGD
jgi:hypothetical protein